MHDTFMDGEEIGSRCPRYRLLGVAFLADHRLGFPLHSPAWGCGVAGLEHAHGQKVWGVLYELDDGDLAPLDEAQGRRGPGDQHNLSDREPVTVELVHPADGSVPRRMRASAYFARSLNPSSPSRRYLDVLIRGARQRGLPEEYVERLGTIPAES